MVNNDEQEINTLIVSSRGEDDDRKGIANEGEGRDRGEDNGGGKDRGESCG